MVTLPPWLVGLAVVYIVSLTALFCYLFQEQWTRRRIQKAKAARIAAEVLTARADPVERHFVDAVGIAVDVEPAPATDELPPVGEADVNTLLVEIYRAQTRARFRGIYGEDGP